MGLTDGAINETLNSKQSIEILY